MSAYSSAWERLVALDLSPRQVRLADALTAVCPLDSEHGRSLRIAVDADPRFGGLLVSTSCGCRALDVRAAVGIPAEPVSPPMTLEELAERALAQGKLVRARRADLDDAVTVLIRDALAAGISQPEAEHIVSSAMRAGMDRGAA